jgi:hypothetical protein
VLTDLAQRFVKISGERFGLFGAFASELVRLRRRRRGGDLIIGPTDMDDETEEHESDHENLVKQQGRRHDEVLFQGDERDSFYRIVHS